MVANEAATGSPINVVDTQDVDGQYLLNISLQPRARFLVIIEPPRQAHRITRRHSKLHSEAYDKGKSGPNSYCLYLRAR
jgi:hypothetical protein